MIVCIIPSTEVGYGNKQNILHFSKPLPSRTCQINKNILSSPMCQCVFLCVYSNEYIVVCIMNKCLFTHVCVMTKYSSNIPISNVSSNIRWH